MNVFISYAEADREIAKALSRVLTQHGLDAWRLDADIFPGDNWAEKYGQALRDADAMVVIISDASSRDRRLLNDITFAISEKKFKNRLVVLFDPSSKRTNTDNIPWSLKMAKTVDLGARDSQPDIFREIATWLKSEEAAV
jgi:hypothetical protein